MNLKSIFGEELKKQGLELGEDIVRQIVVAGFKTASRLADSISNKFIKKAIKVALTFEDEALEAIDKIDGKVEATGEPQPAALT